MLDGSNSRRKREGRHVLEMSRLKPCRISHFRFSQEFVILEEGYRLKFSLLLYKHRGQLVNTVNFNTKMKIIIEAQPTATFLIVLGYFRWM
jgi:hypothetical protein